VTAMTETNLSIEIDGMSCEGCVASVKSVLARIPGLRLIEMRESAVCCGSAGIYSLTQLEMSARLARRKVEAIQQTGAEIVATANPGCASQVEAGLRDVRYQASVKHIVELLDDAYR